MFLKKSGWALLIAASLGMSTANAAGSYIGIGFGKSEVKSWVTEEDVTQIFLDAGTTPPTSGHGESSDSAMKIYLGIAASENIDIRLGYTNLGEATFKGENSSLIVNGSVENQGVFADFLAKFKPVERISLYGKLGVAFMKTDLTVNAAGAGGFYEENLSGDSFVLVPGVGVSVDLGSRVGLALEYERYMDVGDEEETGQSDVDAVSAGLYVRF